MNEGLGELRVPKALFYKSIIDQDANAVVICNFWHEIIYMNPAAVKRYEKSERRLFKKESWII